MNACYHHSNCLDRPVVATCAACGKNLCGECAGKFRSQRMKKSLCVDCFNKELEQTRQANERLEKEHKKKSKLMIFFSLFFGAFPILIGLVLLLVGLFSVDPENLKMGIIMLVLGVWVGSLFTSFIYVVKFTRKIASAIKPFLFKLILGIVAFFIGVALSPIFFFVNLAKHVKKSKQYAYWSLWAKKTIEENNKWLLKARSMRADAVETEETIALKKQIQTLEKKLVQENKADGNSAAISELAAKVAVLTEKLTKVQEDNVVLRSDLELNREGDKKMMEDFEAFQGFIGSQLAASK